MPSMPKDPTRKIMAITVSAEAHKATRLFAATNDLNHEKVVEYALLELHRMHPNYELNIPPEPRVRAPSTVPFRKGKARQAAE